MNKRCEEILKELESENKLKIWWNFKFPEKQELILKLKDMLDDVVDDKYYLNDEIVSNYTPVNEGGNVIGKLNMNKWQDNMKRIYNINKYAPTINTMQGGNLEPKILTTKINYMSKKYNEFVNKNGYVPKMFNPYNSTEIKDIAPTQTANSGCTTSSNTILINESVEASRIGIKVRKLTPLECWRLMGFNDDDFNIVKKALNDTFYKGKDKSNSQLYKQAGNSIVVNVLFEIFKNLFNDKEIL